MSTFSPKRESASPDSGLGDDSSDDEYTGVIEKEIQGKMYLIDETDRELFDHAHFMETGGSRTVGYWCGLDDVVAEFSEEENDFTQEGYAIMKTEYLAALIAWSDAAKLKDESDKVILQEIFQIDVKISHSKSDEVVARGVAEGKKINTMVSVDSDSWEDFQKQLSKYKTEKEKQKKFKDYTYDRAGEKARVIYRDGSFYEKASKRKIVCAAEFLEGKEITCVGGLLGLMSASFIRGWFSDKLLETDKIKIRETIRQGVMEGLHTGNHYRNQSVKCGRGLYGRH
tara:strand:+ start:74 stop:925 length:852 start_codon:yes stop_codon:yes gene_type:complete